MDFKVDQSPTSGKADDSMPICGVWEKAVEGLILCVGFDVLIRSLPPNEVGAPLTAAAAATTAAVAAPDEDDDDEEEHEDDDKEDVDSALAPPAEEVGEFSGAFLRRLEA